MRTAPLLEETVIEPKNLIGTKWNAWGEHLQNRIMLEFVDTKNCIFTSEPKKYPMTYTVVGGKLFLACLEGSFELRGQVLFNYGLPAFEKTA